MKFDIPKNYPSKSEIKKQYDLLYLETPTLWATKESNDLSWKYLEPYFDKRKIERVLEIGCGSGHTLDFYSKKHPAQYLGVDISEEVIKHCKRKYPSPCIQFEQGFFEELKEEKFDLILAIGAFEHIPETEEAFQKLTRLMYKESIAYIEIPNSVTFCSPINEEGFRKSASKTQWEWHLFRETWERIIKENGLSILESHTGPNKVKEFLWILEKKV
jgi:ubiquinone/menaquinone biosynthesis C-methylase UbiE